MMTKTAFPTKSRLLRVLGRFLRAEDGAAAIEYAAIIGLGAFLVIPALALAGLKLTNTFMTIQASIGAVDNTPTGSVPPSISAGNSPPAYDPGSPVESLPPAPMAPELIAIPIPVTP